ncbi:MAG: glycosyltransferase family 4 protein [Propionibacteriaceae bacterium]|nr:glycosyltransferase family 4 protein [Propionibacteriaceae bacterium]
MEAQLPLIIALFAVALVVGALAPAVVQPVLRRLELLDVPNARSSHTQVTLRGGGLAPLATVLVCWIVWVAVDLDALRLWPLIGVPALLALVGFVEDARTLGVRERMAAQCLITAVPALVASIVLFGPGSAGDSGRDTYLGLFTAVAAGLLLMAAGVFCVNAANFMDGINGISSFQGLVAGGSAILVGLFARVPDQMALGVITAGAFAGFLPWNFPKAKMFLGDVGSYLLGALMWVLGACSWLFTGSLLVAAAPIAVYTTDVCVTLFRRWRTGKKLTESHREHAYQLLAAARHSHALATAVATTASAIVVVTAITTWLLGCEPLGWILGLLTVAAYEVVCLRLSRGSRTASPDPGTSPG